MHVIVITKEKVALGIVLWLCILTLCAGVAWNPLGLLWVLGTPGVLMLPGMLTMLYVPLRELGLWPRLLVAVGLSVLELMLLGLAINTFLPLFGVERPLDSAPVLWAFVTSMLLLLAFSWVRLPTITFSLPRYILARTRLDAVFILVPILLVLMSIVGTLRLNNDEGNTLVLFMLSGVAVYSVFLIRYAEHLGRHVLPTALFFIALAVLLMTSLRGWYISGHDIQREFFVFSLAKDAGVWDIATYRDAYNACLSITILPTI